jgi:hypothetical protein
MATYDLNRTELDQAIDYLPQSTQDAILRALDLSGVFTGGDSLAQVSVDDFPPSAGADVVTRNSVSGPVTDVPDGTKVLLFNTDSHRIGAGSRAA